MFAMNDLKGRVAVVTGSTSGIGLAFARAVALCGGDVVLNGLGDADAIEKTRADLAAETGVRVLYHPADMTQPDQIEDMIATTQRELGRLDILVNNAGIQHVEAVENFPADAWEKIIAINLSSTFYATKAAIPIMKAQGRGRIINIASAHGLVASPFKSAYVAAKHGVIGFTKTVALELAQDNITCNAICPGWVLTPLVQQQIDERARQDGDEQRARHDLLAEKQPSLDFVTPAQLGALALFLCSEAGDQVRGAAWNMDGGWVAQ